MGCGGVSALPWVNNLVGDGRDRVDNYRNGNQVVAEGARYLSRHSVPAKLRPCDGDSL